MDKKHVMVRLTENEFITLEKKINESGMSKQEYLKRAALNKKIVKIDGIDNLANQVRMIGININQIARIANENKDISKEQLKKAIEQVKKVWNLVNDFTSKTN
jgi:chemotaxis protein histidine kinase CheA